MKERKFWYIDFSGYCVVEEDTKEKAEQSFWKNIYPAIEGPISNEWYEIDCIEEVGTEKQLSMFDE